MVEIPDGCSFLSHTLNFKAISDNNKAICYLPLLLKPSLTSEKGPNATYPEETNLPPEFGSITSVHYLLNSLRTKKDKDYPVNLSLPHFRPSSWMTASES